MAVYSAVVSLVQLLKQLLDSDEFPVDYPKPLIESLHGKVSSLQSTLDEISFVPKKWRSDVNDLEIKIRDDMYGAQDMIESLISQSLSSESDREIPQDHESAPSINSLEEIITNIDRVAEEAKKIADGVYEEHQETRDTSSSENVHYSQSSFSSNSTNYQIVGHYEDKMLLEAELLRPDDKFQIIPISGMAGIGKTTLARNIYDDEDIQKYFHMRSWVTVSQDYHIGKILEKLLHNMEGYGQKYFRNKVSQGSDAGQLSVQLRQSLYETRYLIVIDDIWDVQIWDKIKNSLPDDRKGSRIVLTTRSAIVATHAQPSGYHHVMRPLSLDQSWELLCYKVFGGDHCPRYLQEIGKKIAKNCGGLPLSITVVGGVLSLGTKTVEYWSSIEEDINVAAAKSEESYSEILSLSYKNLPGELKGCFLYMAAFPENSEILVSKLIKLWVAEGFLTPPSPPRSIEQVAEMALKGLLDRNLIFVRKYGCDGRIKTCGVFNSLRELAQKESENDKFFYSINKHVGEVEEGAESQRRVSVHETNLMCRKQVYQSTKSIKLARTLLYVGPHYPYPLPFCLTFKLLRVFDALTVFFIEFPDEVIKLIHLRYLSFTYNGKLPSSLSKLKNLQILMVRRTPKIIVVGISFLPEEIWNMPQLRHLLFTESDLPGAEILGNNSVLLANLQTLSNVSAVSCTKEALRNMANLKKLGMWIEMPGAVGFYLDQLEQLEAFKFTVLNPIPNSRMDFQPQLFFPETLRKLSLSGCGLPWDDMEVIRRQLPNLQVLKLRELAFQGEEWCLEERAEFPSLKFLLLEYLDLKCWEANHTNFPSLERLIIKHCYELEEMNPEIGDIGGLRLIELVDCSHDAVEWACEVKAEQKYKRNLQVRIYSSWD